MCPKYDRIRNLDAQAMNVISKVVETVDPINPDHVIEVESKSIRSRPQNDPMSGLLDDLSSTMSPAGATEQAECEMLENLTQEA
jgi:hypothetical protein